MQGNKGQNRRVLHDKGDEEKELSGLHDVAIKKSPPNVTRSQFVIKDDDSGLLMEFRDIPLPPARVALERAVKTAVEKHRDALGWLGDRMQRANNMGSFTVKCNLGDI